MYDAIVAARYEVLLEMYWFGSDRTGRRFADALMQKAREGLAVRVIYDAVGSIESDEAMFREMVQAGVEVHEYNPIAPWRERFRFSRIGRRDHRKLLILDGLRAFTGGFNLADQWAPLEEGGGGFHDDGVEIVGPAVRELRWLFHRTFPKPPIMLPVLPEEAGDCPVKVLAPELGQRRRDIYDSYVNAFARATSDITITNSYFIPPGRVRRALARATARGVIVRVIVPRLSDVKIVQLASRALYEHLLSQNIQIFEWDGGVLHAKTAAVDDHWCTVGTFNFDALSIHQNLEVNVAMESPEVTRMLRERITRDLATSVPVDLAVFRKRSWFTKLVERVCFAFRFLL